jgi:hypothetical protein
MGWRWWKAFRFGPLHATVSSRGIGWNIGTSFLRFGIGPAGACYVLVCIPGTGIGFIKYLGQPFQRHVHSALPPSQPFQRHGHGASLQSGTMPPPQAQSLRPAPLTRTP